MVRFQLISVNSTTIRPSKLCMNRRPFQSCTSKAASLFLDADNS